MVGRHGGSTAAGSGSTSTWADDWVDDWFDEGDPNHPEFEGGGGASEPVTEMETWIILEFCDCGTLQSGIDRGFFRQHRTCRPPSPPSLPVVLATALQMAEALSYLHGRDIIHGAAPPPPPPPPVLCCDAHHQTPGLILQHLGG